MSDATPPAPGSRRAARQARMATGAIPVVGDAGATPVPAAARPAAPQPDPAPAATPPSSAPQSGEISFDALFSAPRTPVIVPEPEDARDPAEEWMLAGASRAGRGRSRVAAGGDEPEASPGYARTGEIRVPSGPTTTVTSFEDLFEGADDGSSGRGRKGRGRADDERPRRRIGGWIALGVVLLIFGGIGAGAWYVWTNYEDKIREVMGWEEPKDYEAGQATGEALLTISSGDVPSTISQSLYDAGVTKTPDAFYDMLIKTGQNPTFYPGVYRLQQKMTSEAALAALQDPANKLENSALLREGLTVEQSLPILAEGTGIPLEDFQAAVADPSAYGIAVDADVVAAGGQALEGWLFPAMYTFNPGVTAEEVIQTLVDRTVQSLDAAGVPADKRQEILTIAAIIQREARFEQDFYKVSRVIQNRLDPSNQETFGYLQMDSTAQYGYGELHDGTVSSSAEALADDNPWNTYKRTGLPVGPISNPGDVAIDAAMHPADGDWMYFVTVNLDTGETVFTSNLADHNRAVNQWLSWCADHPDSGC